MAPVPGDASSDATVHGSPTPAELDAIVAAITAWAANATTVSEHSPLLRAASPPAGTVRAGGARRGSPELRAGSPPHATSRGLDLGRRRQSPRSPSPPPVPMPSAAERVMAYSATAAPRSRELCRRRQSPRSPSTPPAPMPSAASAAPRSREADPLVFAPPARQPRRDVASHEPPFHAALRADVTAQASLDSDFDAAPATTSIASSVSPVDSDEEDHCCRSCGAPAVKTEDSSSASYVGLGSSYRSNLTRSPRASAEEPHELSLTTARSARDLACVRCSCRRDSSSAETSLPPQRLVVIIRRYVRCILPPPVAQPMGPSTSSWSAPSARDAVVTSVGGHPAVAAANASSARVASQQQPSLLIPAQNQGETASIRFSTHTAAAMPHQLPPRVLLPSRD